MAVYAFQERRLTETIYRFSSYRPVHALPLGYKNQPVDDTQENNRRLLLDPCKAHKYIKWEGRRI